VPLTDEHTDLTRQLGQFPAAGPDQIGPASLVCSGQLHALIPLMPERLGPWRELLVSQLAVGLDRANHLPALTAAEFQEAIGSIPTVAEHRDLEPGQVKAAVRPPACLGPGWFACESAADAREPVAG